MKTLSIICALFLGVSISYAQPANVVNAYNYLNSGELDKAEESINKAAEHEKTKESAKTWYYRGKIYFAITSKYDQYSTEKRRQAYLEAGRSFRKAKSMDHSRIDSKDLDRNLKLLNNMCLNEGVGSFNDKDFETAASLFEESVLLAEVFQITDTLALYNVGLSHERLKNYDKAIEAYRKCANLGYRGADMYSFISYCYTLAGDNEKSKAVILEGFERYPKNQTMITSVINSFLREGRIQEASDLLSEAIKNDPNNAVLHFSKGALMDALQDDPKEVQATYEKAIELDPTYFDPYYNLGAYYYNQGVEINNQASNEMDNAKYKELNAQATELFKKALVPLEKAHEINPEDTNTMQSLEQLYARLGMNDKYQEIKEKLRN